MLSTATPIKQKTEEEIEIAKEKARERSKAHYYNNRSNILLKKQVQRDLKNEVTKVRQEEYNSSFLTSGIINTPTLLTPNNLQPPTSFALWNPSAENDYLKENPTPSLTTTTQPLTPSLPPWKSVVKNQEINSSLPIALWNQNNSLLPPVPSVTNLSSISPFTPINSNTATINDPNRNLQLQTQFVEDYSAKLYLLQRLKNETLSILSSTEQKVLTIEQERAKVSLFLQKMTEEKAIAEKTRQECIDKLCSLRNQEIQLTGKMTNS